MAARRHDAASPKQHRQTCGLEHRSSAYRCCLAEQHINPRRLFLLSNRPTGTEDLTGQPLEDVLGRAVDMGWPHVGRNLSLANSRHAPYHLRFPEDTPSLMLDDIAASILEIARREGVPGIKG